MNERNYQLFLWSIVCSPFLVLGICNEFSIVVYRKIAKSNVYTSFGELTLFVLLKFVLVILNCLMYGYRTDNLGRKAALFLSNVWCALGCIFITVAQNTSERQTTLIFQLIGTTLTNFDISYIPAIVYITELSSDPKLRVLMSTGPLAFSKLGALIYKLQENSAEMKTFFNVFHYTYIWMLSFTSIVILVVLYFRLPDSPYYLVTKNRIQEAEESLTNVKSQDVKNEVKKLVDNQRMNFPEGGIQQQKRIINFIFRTTALKPVVILTVIFIGVVYSGEVLLKNRLLYFNIITEKEPHSYITFGYFLNFGFVLLTGVVSNSFGRKKLFVLCAGINGVFLFVLLYLSETVFNISGIIMSIIWYIHICIESLGYSTVPYLLLAELTSNSARGFSVTCIIVAKQLFEVFLELLSTFLRSFTLEIHLSSAAIITFIVLFFALFFLPETQHMSLIATEKYFRMSSWRVRNFWTVPQDSEDNTNGIEMTNPLQTEAS